MMTQAIEPMPHRIPTTVGWNYTSLYRSPDLFTVEQIMALQEMAEPGAVAFRGYGGGYDHHVCHVSVPRDRRPIERRCGLYQHLLAVGCLRFVSVKSRNYRCGYYEITDLGRRTAEFHLLIPFGVDDAGKVVML
jgi:hypothetical protein